MDCADNLLDNCDGIKLVALSGAISAILAENLNLDDQNVVANVLLGIGQNLAIIAAQNSKFQSCVETCTSTNNNNTTTTNAHDNSES